MPGTKAGATHNPWQEHLKLCSEMYHAGKAAQNETEDKAPRKRMTKKTKMPSQAEVKREVRAEVAKTRKDAEKFAKGLDAAHKKARATTKKADEETRARIIKKDEAEKARRPEKRDPMTDAKRRAYDRLHRRAKGAKDPPKTAPKAKAKPKKKTR